MWWTWIAVLVGGGIGLLAPDLAQADTWRHAKHFHRPPVYESHSHLSRSSSRKEMSFETLRMLSTGMTKAEVLSRARSEEHTSELQSRQYLVCRLLLEKKKT